MSEHRGFGDEVRAARAAAGLSLADVSSRTKIRPTVLSDLEAGSTARSGGSAYARGHLKAIARATGCDAGVLLSAFDRWEQGPAGDDDGDDVGVSVVGAGAAPGSRPGELPAAGVTAAAPAVLAPAVLTPASARSAAARGGSTLLERPLRRAFAVPIPLPTPARERTGPRWGLAALGAAAVLSLLVLLGSLTGGGPSSRDAASVAVAPTVPPAPVVVAPVPAPSAAAGAALQLQVVGSDSWVSVVTATGESLFTGVLSAGERKEFTHDGDMQVTVGNAGAVRLGCAGQDAPAGRRGQVKHYTCGADGLALV